MAATLLPFIAEDELQCAVMVLDIALARGCRYQRALDFAVESLGQRSRDVDVIAERMIEKRWQSRALNACRLR